MAVGDSLRVFDIKDNAQEYLFEKIGRHYGGPGDVEGRPEGKNVIENHYYSLNGGMLVMDVLKVPMKSSRVCKIRVGGSTGAVEEIVGTLELEDTGVEKK